MSVHLFIFCLLFAVVLSEEDAGEIKSQSGSDFGDSAAKPLFTDVKQFYNDDGTYKLEILAYRPEVCHYGGIRRSTTLTWCPTPYLNDHWEWKCIRAEDFCNGIKDCPNGEDESEAMCLHTNSRQDKLNKAEEDMTGLYYELLKNLE